MWGNISKTTCKLYTNKKFIGPIFFGQNYTTAYISWQKLCKKCKKERNAISVFLHQTLNTKESNTTTMMGG